MKNNPALKLVNPSSEMRPHSLDKPNGARLVHGELERAKLEDVLAALNRQTEQIGEIKNELKTGRNQSNNEINEIRELKSLLREARIEIQNSSASKQMTIISLFIMLLSLLILISVFLAEALVLTFYHGLVLLVIGVLCFIMSRLVSNEDGD